MSTLSTPWAMPPAVICDFGWYGTETLAIFGNLIYDVAGNTYPPAGAHFQDYTLDLNTPVTFDAFDSETLGIPKTVIPAGIGVVEYSWDLGNGQNASGPLTTTIYYTASPDASATLTIIDSLGRQTSTTHRLNLIDFIFIEGSRNRVVEGSDRS